MFIRSAAPIFAAAVAALALSGPAHAQANVMKECGAEYQSAKSANQLGGKTWNQYLAECRTRHAAQPAAAPAAPAANNPLKPAPTTTATPAKPDAKPDSKPAAKPAATGAAVFPTAISSKYSSETPAKQRMKTCLDQYNANKASGANGGLNWIMKGGGYYSECNKRLKG